jgi:2-polyprenyl-3-methyl-5-hydroxy-6-metoxy-1,4-benzoquinol methylase
MSSPATPSILAQVVTRIAASDASFAPFAAKLISDGGSRFQTNADAFWGRYNRFIETQGKSLEFGVQNFLRLRADMQQEWLAFQRTGVYSSSSFAEVEQRVYGCPEVMEQHMHGLVFAQFLWPEQYRRFTFFSDHLAEFTANARRYLEVGGGHALYIIEAARQLPAVEFDLLDISKSSIELAQGMAAGLPIQYHLADIMEFHPERRYDFITMGEVLEHLEDPIALLRRVRELLADGGHAYITTPVNAPMIDHIYLFRDAEDIRELLRSCGFTVEKEVTQYAKEMPEKRAKALRLPQMYAAFVS